MININKLLKIYLSISIFVLSISTVLATNDNEWQQYYPYLDGIGTMEKGPTVILDGVVNSTYWQFENVDEAFSRSYENLNNTIKVTCKFTVFNYNSYQSQSYTQTKTITYENVSDYHNFQ